MTNSATPGTGVPVCYRHPDRESHIRCQRCDRPICPDCMRDASVGFQCPSCVAEGAKTTRSGRTTYGGLRPTNASTTSIAIIAVNVGVWLAITLSGGQGSRLVDLLSLRPNGLCLFSGGGYEVTRNFCSAQSGQYLPGVADGAYWQLLTSAFTHVEVLHIAFNMFALWVLGPQLELAIGRVRFLALYLISALTGSALVYLLSPEYQATLGASGAVFGLMAALLVLAIKQRSNQVQSILVWIGINAAFTLYGRNISWQGHLGGFLGGLVIAGILVYAPRPRRAQLQTVGLGAVAAVALVAIFLRSAALA